MAELNSNMAEAGDNGHLRRDVNGTETQYAILGGAYANRGVVYPDSSCSIDIIRSDFKIPNTFYFTFYRSEGLKQFQIMYRYKKRYAPANAAVSTLDTSGADVWTDWSTWETETGTQDDPGEEVASINITGDLVVWKKELAHTYSEINDFDKVIYQFRARAYNSALNECGQWYVCDLAVTYPPAITGYSCTHEIIGGTEGMRVGIRTNYQRPVKLTLKKSSYDPTNEYIVRETSSTPDIDLISFTLPSIYINSTSADFLYSVLADANDANCCRWCATITPSYKNRRYWYSFVFSESHVEPTLPEPKVEYDASNQQITFYVKSSNTSPTTYDTVQGSIQWEDANTNKASILELDFSYDKTTSKWSATALKPPLDLPLTLKLAVITDDYMTRQYTNIIVPSNGLLCFDGDLGSVRLKYNQSISTGDTIAGETIECVGREFPISRYGGVLSREIKLEATMLNSDILGGDGWKSNVEPLSGQADWILRIPGGEKYRVMITSLDRNTENPTNNKLLSVSISCKVVGYE